MNRGVVLRALKNLCTFIGAIALFSYFFNWFVDLRHWYVTLGSALVCGFLWLGFYVIELRGGVERVAGEVVSRLSHKTQRKASGPESGPELQVPGIVAWGRNSPEDVHDAASDDRQSLQAEPVEVTPPVAETTLQTDAPAVPSELGEQVAKPNALPWLNRRRSKTAVAGKESS